VIGIKFAGLPVSRADSFSNGVTGLIYTLSVKTLSEKDNVAKRAINGAHTSVQDWMTDVGILSIGNDFPSIKLISFMK